MILCGSSYTCTLNNYVVTITVTMGIEMNASDNLLVASTMWFYLKIHMEICENYELSWMSLWLNVLSYYILAETML